MDSLLPRGGEEPQICINWDCYFSCWLVTVEKFYAWGTAFQFSVWTCHAESKSGKNGENKNMKYRKYKKNIVEPLRTCISHSALWRWGNFWNWFFSLWTKEKQASSWWNCGASACEWLAKLAVPLWPILKMNNQLKWQI